MPKSILIDTCVKFYNEESIFRELLMLKDVLASLKPASSSSASSTSASSFVASRHLCQPRLLRRPPCLRHPLWRRPFRNHRRRQMHQYFLRCSLLQYPLYRGHLQHLDIAYCQIPYRFRRLRLRRRLRPPSGDIHV